MAGGACHTLPMRIARLSPHQANFVLAYGAALAIGIIAVAFTLPPWALRGMLPPAAPYGADAGAQILVQRYFLTQPWHWDLLHVDHLMQPWGVNLGQADGIPLATLVAKALRPILPPFDQVATLWLALSWLCQPASAVFALRGTGENRLLPSLCIALMAASLPTFLARLHHPSMSAHFLLLMLMGCYFRAVAGSRLALWAGCALAAMLLLVHPYMLFMGLAFPAAMAATLCFRRNARWREAAAALVITLGGVALFTHILGLAAGRSAGIYGVHTLNLAGLFYPARSGLFPGFPISVVDATGGQGEGYAYLGAGLLLVLAADLLRPRLIWQAVVRHAGLALACAALLILALSHRVFLFHTLVLHLHTATGLMNSFRASGRFVWVPTYTLLVGGVALLARGRPAFARAILPAAAFLAVWDGSAIWAHDRTWLARPAPWYFDASRMRALLRAHDELTILPPAGCIPGFDMGVVQPLYLAAETDMPTSTMYIARHLHYSVLRRRFCARTGIEARRIDSGAARLRGNGETIAGRGTVPTNRRLRRLQLKRISFGWASPSAGRRHAAATRPLVKAPSNPNELSEHRRFSDISPKPQPRM